MYKLCIGDLIITEEDLDGKDVTIFNGERYFFIPNSLKMILEPYINIIENQWHGVPDSTSQA